MTRTQWLSAIVVGLAITALFWIDPIFVPLALLGPLVAGAIAGARAVPWPWVAVAWTVAGVGAIVSDWVVNHEDVAFHALLTVVMVALASAAWWAAQRVARRDARVT